MKYNAKMEVVSVALLSGTLADSPETFIDREERAYQHKIDTVCDIVEKNHQHLILLTGPSASGKTTTAKKIALELKAKGKKVNRISLDNFYKPASELPHWEDGYQNYEAVEGLDIPCFHAFMNELLKQGRALLPIFDFKTGCRSEKTVEILFDEHTYLIIEGIHALNPQLTDPLAPFQLVKIYISTHSDFVAPDGKIILTARDLRLTRRLLRDYYYRGTGAEATLKMWDYVLRGEDLYIRPFRRYADLHINSTHDYEPFLYHDPLKKLLASEAPGCAHAAIMKRLEQAAPYFFGIEERLIPQSSLIQEFIKQD